MLLDSVMRQKDKMKKTTIGEKKQRTERLNNNKKDKNAKQQKRLKKKRRQFLDNCLNSCSIREPWRNKLPP